VVVSAEQACQSLLKVKQLRRINNQLHINIIDENNRQLLYRLSSQGEQSIIAQDIDNKSSLNGYGGGSFEGNKTHRWLTSANKLFYQSNDEQTLVSYDVTAGDLQYDIAHQRCLAVIDDIDSDRQYVADCQQPTKRLLSNADFFNAPICSPCGQYIAYICRCFPNMPWDNTELRLAPVSNNGAIDEQRSFTIAGNNNPSLALGESISQPYWLDCDNLFYLSDTSGYWGLYCHSISTQSSRAIYTPDADICAAPWEAGHCNYIALAVDDIICTVIEHGCWQLIRHQQQRSRVLSLGQDICFIHQLCHIDSQIFFAAAGINSHQQIYCYDLITESMTKIGSHAVASQTEFQAPQSFQVPLDGAGAVQGFFYPACQQQCTEPAPVIFRFHGGPTSYAHPGLDLTTRFFTTHGFSVVDVNYRGSAGFGRQSRHQLYGHWGRYEVEDCRAIIDYLAAKGLINPKAAFARGNSSGGFAALCIATFSSLLNGAMVSSGISDLNLLFQHTHRFERHYIQQLLQQDYSTEPHSRWAQHSPIHFAAQLKTPVFFIQGANDTICPPEQTQRFIRQLEDNNIFHQLLFFNDEGHGVKQAKNQQLALKTELDFYQTIIAQAE
jgi:dipeptidyl aminopeptidase/acylaminoacyl peptidase